MVLNMAVALTTLSAATASEAPINEVSERQVESEFTRALTPLENQGTSLQQKTTLYSTPISQEKLLTRQWFKG